MTTERRQLVRFLFLRLDPAWRRLAAHEQLAHKRELVAAIDGFRGRLLLRSFSLAGTRGDADLLLWQLAESLETFQALQTAVFSTRLGAHCAIAHSYLGAMRRSVYELPALPAAPAARLPQASRYLFVYPFTKTRDWYALPLAERQSMMEEHVAVARRFPGVRANTAYSFGLDDAEFVVAFEGDDPAEFSDLVMALREVRASAFTARDTPVFTCLQMSLAEALDTLGGAPALRAEAPVAAAPNGGGHRDGRFVPVARVGDVPVGAARRVYSGDAAVALFNVDGRYFAVSDRCPHGRASLSEGCVDGDACVLTCPWHRGEFDLRSGEPLGGPPRAPIRTYEVRVHGDQILIA
jgi:chlorite dismutase/nitrite reductase/ring-hydroxylating ferredoxin subunit